MMRYISLRHTIVLAIVALALGGAWVSGTLLVGHDGGWHAERLGTGYLLRACGSPGYPSVSCADVVSSRWGSVDFYLGRRQIVLPTSLIGLAYFVSIAIWFAMTGPMDSRRRRLWSLTLLGVTGGLSGSVFFMGVMAYSISKWCSLCVAIHGVNLLIFVLTVWLWRRSVHCRGAGMAIPPEEPVAVWAQRRLAFCAATFAVSASVGSWMYYESVSHSRRNWRENTGLKQAIAELQNDADFMLREFKAQPVMELPYRDLRSEQMQTSYAGPELIVFTDYDCGPCACFEYRRRSLFDTSVGDGLRVDYRQGPASGAGPNATDQAPGSEGGAFSPANRAMQAARLQGNPAAFEAMRRLMFRHRRDRPRRDYVGLARLAGLDADRFRKDMESEAVRTGIEDDLSLARALGVERVPAAFLNGRRVPDLCIQSSSFWSAVATGLASHSRVASVEEN